MHLKEITSAYSKESIELIKAGRTCNLKIYLLNDEYKVIHVRSSKQNRVSVSHLSFKKIPEEILKYLVEDFLETYESNVYLFTLGDSPIVHIHHEILNKSFYAEENAHADKFRKIQN
ncbi:hypothetical protein F9U64_19165 [Gracilibacillus oryzae]|uniref:HIT domain-containing protein n=1 Tax=Gracilibacillus oryzae TaxID=1672701 RepID=A0A7C8GQY0_9BACI|nr:hypothetical protein [Gracilibacillus oryzae]KAB8126939.1 hypothetical protein F9U64_19165 [Gracilibacillus oryzae]